MNFHLLVLSPRNQFKPLLRNQKIKIKKTATKNKNSGITGNKILETHRQVIQDTEDDKQNLLAINVEKLRKQLKTERKLQREKKLRLGKQASRLSATNPNSFKQEDMNLILSLLIEGEMTI